uniref:Uncharacterized protein n=1 Tax=Chromera velia CCMP2878 TaxID=1169474 RepID=A0A0G4FTU5_9ALVE|mmetsp:Transcript_12036/g.23195  ORF Transcript_12036/g.23195 Transcript_12036/m.23195 type:complete len:98 (-) Transcript_12036:636-929(-)|eukprot:Cvel_18604.t1-p1 / transcript=Cvel_18604.t1 / gene=Cvel_18604 / organism=Chromera_velia_CCMP2878 / gene_product=hypothetical protein / transcript_product=hypothetical protein / location=Cvel_scaffold1552:22545-22835(-) / protein_length=97 / sequence_SO=supercontig / SO=protein_coding / is_pseudo=false
MKDCELRGFEDPGPSGTTTESPTQIESEERLPLESSCVGNRDECNHALTEHDCRLLYGCKWGESPGIPEPFLDTDFHKKAWQGEKEVRRMLAMPGEA